MTDGLLTLHPARRPSEKTKHPLLISAIVVSFNTREMTLACLDRLAAELEGLPSEIWVVDNASIDGSAEAIAERMPGVRVIANSRNTGFGAANNLAMAGAQGEFFLLINSDAFVRPGSIRRLVEVMRRRPDIGVAGPKLLNADGTLQRSVFNFPSPLHCWRDNLWLARDPIRPSEQEAQRVPWIVGAAMLVRREVFESVGGFDERFFMYAEESDWQRRISSGGWEIVYVPSAEIDHRGGGSASVESVRGEQFFQSLDAYVLKHHGVAGFVSMRLAMVVGCSLRAAIWTTLGVFSPARRRKAWGKARHHLWLVRRQATWLQPVLIRMGRR